MISVAFCVTAAARRIAAPTIAVAAPAVLIIPVAAVRRETVNGRSVEKPREIGGGSATRASAAERPAAAGGYAIAGARSSARTTAAGRSAAGGMNAIGHKESPFTSYTAILVYSMSQCRHRFENRDYVEKPQHSANSKFTSGARKVIIRLTLNK